MSIIEKPGQGLHIEKRFLIAFDALRACEKIG